MKISAASTLLTLLALSQSLHAAEYLIDVGGTGFGSGHELRVTGILNVDVSTDVISSSSLFFHHHTDDPIPLPSIPTHIKNEGVDFVDDSGSLFIAYHSSENSDDSISWSNSNDFYSLGFRLGTYRSIYPGTFADLDYGLPKDDSDRVALGGHRVDRIKLGTAVVPEPTSQFMLFIGFLGFVLQRRAIKRPIHGAINTRCTRVDSPEAKDRRKNNCRILKVAITLRRDDSRHELDSYCSAGPNPRVDRFGAFGTTVLASAARVFRLKQALTLALSLVALTSHDAFAFRVIDVSSLDGFTHLGVARWNAAPHTVDGVERSLDGGLRYSVEGGSYEAFRDRFEWADPMPTVAEFQAAVEGAFAAWEVQDPETGLGTDLYFVPDFETPIVIEPVPDDLEGVFKLNRGSEIDLTSYTTSSQTDLGLASSFGDPNSDSVTLTSGVPGYSAAVFSGADIRMRRTSVEPGTHKRIPWNLTVFESTLAHEIGHVLSVHHPNASADNSYISAFYDDNFDPTSHATAAETLTNSFADLIDPLDPDNSPALKQFELCNNPDGGENCASSPGSDSPGVVLIMEADLNDAVVLQNDEFAARQFLYPFVKVTGDFNADKELTVSDIDLLSTEIRTGEPRYWFDVDGNETVDDDDRTEWVHVLQNTWFGDSNLDGEFNSGDLTLVFQTGQYEDGIVQNSTWATGDWDGDGEFGSADLVVAFQDGGYEQGAHAAVLTVPEPHSATILFVGGILCLGFSRRRASRTL